MEKPEYRRWEDLLPVQAGGFDDPYEQLSPRQLADLAMLRRVLWLLETGRADAGGGMDREADRIRQAFAKDGLDADWLLSQREAVHQNRIRRSRNPDLDGRPLRLLGQMLPLSWSEDHRITELLLTAAVGGTCSHMPLPPYNQVAYVNAVEPVDMNALVYQRGALGPWVWVEGTIRYVVSTHILNRVDGEMRVEAAYSIDPAQITPASDADLAWRVEQDRQASEALLYPSLTDLLGRE